MKKIIAAIVVIALAVIVGIGAGYYFSHRGSGPNGASATLSETEAQKIALDDAGLAEADVNFTQTKLDRDDGRQKYDIEFIASANNTKYDYEIDAESGAILSVDREVGRGGTTTANNSQPSAQTGTTTTTGSQAEGEITADEAKAIALQNAGIAETDVLYIDIDYDHDDGRTEWSVSFATQSTEYDYEIAAADGSILKSEQEPNR